MQIATGSYTGNGSDDRSITGIGFQPDAVFVQKRGFGASFTVYTADMAADDSKEGSLALTSDKIQALESDGFQVGTDDAVNTNTADYDYIAIKQNASQDCEVGSYTGNATDNRTISLSGSWTPEFVLVIPDSADAMVWRTEASSDDDRSESTEANEGGSNRIQDFGAGSFEVGTDADVNASGVTYYYIAIDGVDDLFRAGSYTGNPNDDRDITMDSPTWQPDAVWVSEWNPGFHDGNAFRVDHSGDDCSLMHTSGAGENYIQAINSDGFQVGTGGLVNTSSQAHVYFLFKDGNSDAAALGADEMMAARQRGGVQPLLLPTEMVGV